MVCVRFRAHSAKLMSKRRCQLRQFARSCFEAALQRWRADFRAQCMQMAMGGNRAGARSIGGLTSRCRMPALLWGVHRVHQTQRGRTFARCVATGLDVHLG